MAASIRSYRNGIDPIVGASRDDLQVGDVITVEAAVTASTYAWNIVYKPEGSTAAFSGSATQQSPGTFTVDKEGPYLIRLIVDLGLATEHQQFVRLRYLTKLGDLRLVAAGEQVQSAVPVDIDPDGWANDQNYNLTTLLGLVARVSSSGRLYYVDTNASDGGYADFMTVQEAVDAAVAEGASVTTPWTVAVRPGTYTEDVTFHPHVHVVGMPGNLQGAENERAVVLRGTHVAAMGATGDLAVFSNLTLESVSTTTNATLQKTGNGTVFLHRCGVLQSAASATQGPAFLLSEGAASLSACTLLMSVSAADDRVAVRQEGGSTTLTLKDSLVRGPSGLSLNPDLQTSVVSDISDCRIISTGGAAAIAISSAAESLTLEYSRVQVSTGKPLWLHPTGSSFAGDVSATVRWSFLEGGIEFDIAGLSGTSTLRVGSSEYTGFTFPNGTPTNLTATTRATSLFYDNTLTGISAENVQAAIDEVYTFASQVRTLDDAYDGGSAGAGSGRTIYADQGAVQIADSDPPSDPIPAGNTNGRLRVVSNVEVGSFGMPEIDLDPNPFGNGPLLTLGNAVWANNTSFGSTATVMARATEDPLYRNYNLRVQTQSATAGSRVGRLILKGGDGLPNGASTPHAGSVYIEGGKSLAGTADPGDVYVIPGQGTSGTGALYLGNPTSATPATLTAAGAAVDPLGVSGTVRFALDTGAVEVDLDAADTLAIVVSKLGALDGITASESAGVITLQTEATGPNAEIFFLSADAGIDAALGGFDGQVQVDGVVSEVVDIRVTADQEISFGVSGATGPMIYNADTGKLTVPGLIDPTGMIFDAAPAPSVNVGQGAIFVGDGSGGTTAGDLYYLSPIGSSPGVAVNMTTGGGGGGGGTVTSVKREAFSAASFTFAAGVSSVTLSSTPDTNAAIDGLYELTRNGVADMTRVSIAPSSADEWWVNGSDLEIGDDITATGDTYKVVYPAI